jgi:hypothetical protein
VFPVSTVLGGLFQQPARLQTQSGPTDDNGCEHAAAVDKALKDLRRLKEKVSGRNKVAKLLGVASSAVAADAAKDAANEVVESSNIRRELFVTENRPWVSTDISPREGVYPPALDTSNRLRLQLDHCKSRILLAIDGTHIGIDICVLIIVNITLDISQICVLIPQIVLDGGALGRAREREVTTRSKRVCALGARHPCFDPHVH